MTLARAWPLVLIVFGAVVLLPWIDEPFCGIDVNAGNYFGVFARNWDHLGFLETRGTPFLATLVDDPRTGIPYVNHLPGTAWLIWLFGSAEWQMRLHSLVWTILGGCAIYSLARLRADERTSLLAALLHMASPATAVFVQMSYGIFVLPIGVVMLATYVRLADAGWPKGRRGPWVVIALCALFGMWLDYVFLAFCAALPFLLVRRPLVRSIARGLVPLAGVAMAALLFVWWKASIDADPTLPNLPKTPMAESFHTVFLKDRPPLTAHLAAIVEALQSLFTWPVLLAAAIGAFWFVRRDARLAVGLTVTGLTIPMLLANHMVLRHRPFVAYASVFLSIAAAMFVMRAGGERVPKFARALAAALLVAAPFAETFALRSGCSTTFFRDLGTIMSRESIVESDDGVRRYTTANAFLAFGYYLDTRHAVPTPIRNVELLRSGVANLAPEIGAKYVWVDYVQDPPIWVMATPPGMPEYLAAFPRERLPELETSFLLDGPARERVTVREAWLYTLKEATPVRDDG